MSEYLINATMIFSSLMFLLCFLFNLLLIICASMSFEHDVACIPLTITLMQGQALSPDK